MTFEQWFASLGGGYDSYADLLKECWEASGSQLTKETE